MSEVGGPETRLGDVLGIGVLVRLATEGLADGPWAFTYEAFPLGNSRTT
ncbi:MAG TPA: hypothetical protein VEN31_08440 [Candidatus Bathyarchaeia archaeon]|nr:hypothetical protein [Candidatus Bathyarchaeia archaeon]